MWFAIDPRPKGSYGYLGVNSAEDKVPSRGHLNPGEVQFALLKCNIQGTKGTRHLTVELRLRTELSPDPKLPSYCDVLSPRDPESAPTLHSQAIAEILSILSNRSLDELDSQQGRKKILDDIRTALEALVKAQAPQAKGSIKDCYFTEFFMR
ncbi:MAG: hypothetical protein RL095_4205 [Verrucomicrobiota bacterium]|jgi:hypothetical protein